MAAQTLPPAKVLSARTVSLDEAHSFVSTFISTSDATRLALSQDLGLNDQRRIAQALEGIYVPKPIEESLKPAAAAEEDTEMGGTESTAAQEEEEGQGEDTTIHEAEATEAPKVVDKEKRKADKKARLKEEKRKRAEEKAREKGEVV